jgi:hypothetical protein
MFLSYITFRMLDIVLLTWPLESNDPKITITRTDKAPGGLVGGRRLALLRRPEGAKNYLLFRGAFRCFSRKRKTRTEVTEFTEGLIERELAARLSA